jgi:formiminotetrahydrofolate cyclodeaminase
MAAMADEQSLESFLVSLSSSEATPGGGAGAAMAVAMGAALVAMAARLSTGRRFQSVEDDMERVAQRCDQIRREALGLMDADACVYERVMVAYRLPRDSEEAREDRAREISIESEKASRIPLKVAAVACEVIVLAREAASKGNSNVSSDAGAGASFARTAIRICEMNVHANLGAISEQSVCDDLVSALQAISKSLALADSTVEEILQRQSG